MKLRMPARSVRRFGSGFASEPALNRRCWPERRRLASRRALAWLSDTSVTLLRGVDPAVVAPVISMLRKFKNPLFEQIVAAGLDPNDFESAEKHNAETIRFDISYRPIDLLFLLSQPVRQQTYFFVDVTRYVGDGNRSPLIRVGVQITLPKVVDRFRKWLKDDVLAAIEDLGLPNFWAEAREAAAVASAFRRSARDADIFTPAERDAIKRELHAFRLVLVQTFEPDARQMEEIAESLSYLEAAVDRLNRFDWKGVALSTVIGIATSLSLDTEKGRLLWRLFQQAMSAVRQVLN
jgi:hypothetical protein